MPNISKIFIRGEIGEHTTLETVRNQIDQSSEVVEVWIDSVGGIVEVGYEICEYLLSLNKELVTVIDGVCASIATKISLVAEPKNRKMSEGSTYMIHNAFGDSITCDANCYRNVADMLDEINLKLSSEYSAATGLPQTRILKMMEAETYMDAKTAKELGFVSEIFTGAKNSIHNHKTIKVITKIKNKVEDTTKWVKDLEAKMDKTTKAIEKIALGMKLKAMKSVATEDDEEIYLGMNPEDDDMLGKKAMNSDGEEIPDGTYVIAEGTLTVEDGVVTEVILNEEEEEDMMAEDDDEMLAEEEEEKQVAARLQKQVSVIYGKLDFITNLLAKDSKKKSAPNVPLIKTVKKMPTKLDSMASWFQNRINQKYPGTFKNVNVVEDSFNYTYPGQLSTDLIYKPSVNVPDITQIFTVREGVRSKQQLLLAGFLSDKIIKAYQGCKGTTLTSDEQASIFNRTLEVTQLEVFLEQCADTFDETILEEWKNLGVTSESIEGTKFQNIVLSLIIDAMSRGLFRIFSWGTVGAASANYNMLDGLWTRLFASETDVSDFGYCGVRVDDIDSLTQTSGSRAIDYLRNLYEAQSSILRQMPTKDKALYVTPNIIDNLATYLEDRSGVDIAIQYLENGKASYTFRGIPIVEVTAWRDHLEDSENPYFGVINTLALLTTPKNHIVGLSSGAAQRETKLWYSWDDNVNKIKALPEFGYNYAHCDLQVFSYGLV